MLLSFITGQQIFMKFRRKLVYVLEHQIDTIFYWCKLINTGHYTFVVCFCLQKVSTHPIQLLICLAVHYFSRKSKAGKVWGWRKIKDKGRIKELFYTIIHNHQHKEKYIIPHSYYNNPKSVYFPILRQWKLWTKLGESAEKYHRFYRN